MINRARIFTLLLATLAVTADQVSKTWAITALGRAGGHVALPGPIDLTLSLNQSNAFGLTPIIGHATRWFLMGANLLVAMLLLVIILGRRPRPLALYGFALIMAGAIGNALDRLLVGAVVDFPRRVQDRLRVDIQRGRRDAGPGDRPRPVERVSGPAPSGRLTASYFAGPLAILLV